MIKHSRTDRCYQWTINYCGKTKTYKCIYHAIMDVLVITTDELVCALDYFMDRKGQALVFMNMCE